MELIRINVHLLFPDALVQKEPPEPGSLLPKSFEYRSRVPKRHTIVTNGMEIALGPARQVDPKELQLPPNHHVAMLALRLCGSDFQLALLNSLPTLESIIDHLSFQMQVAINPLSIDILDVTQKVKVGEERETNIIINPVAVLMPKFYLNPWDMSLQIIPEMMPSLTSSPQVSDVRYRVALWWYVKAMAVPYVVDQLICLLTAIEKLSEIHLIRGPYKTPCHHEIVNCPTCNKPLMHPVRGLSIKTFLIGEGLTEQEANDIWSVRQLIHGKNVFTSERLNHISILTGRLRYVVFRCLKPVLGMAADKPPMLISRDGPTLGSSIGLMGSRKIETLDLEIENALDLAKNGGAKE